MTQDLDALPLPERPEARDMDYARFGYDADDMDFYGRACLIEGYELAMRKAQEGREPRARVEPMMTGGNVGIATRIVEIDDPLQERLQPGTLLYTSPPPKSDEPGSDEITFVGLDDTSEDLRVRRVLEAQAVYLSSKTIREIVEAAQKPKSDEAMDALIKAARWFADNPDSPKSALGHITEALAALAAQQSKGEAS